MARSTHSRRGHWESFKDIVDLWVDLFAKQSLLTYASAIAFQLLVAPVAFLLLAIFGAVGRSDVWSKQIGPHVEPKMLPQVYTPGSRRGDRPAGRHRARRAAAQRSQGEDERGILELVRDVL